ncbi:MAG: molybdopterin-dependent oxidoreductase [Candidatus Hydrogenedens sp.]|nr:molybdopterin-dependent oxidoreductase [Candidatus Hydrogenedentota bacterium]NLF56464.1 molybdopterin-dependent oxidoreductase [Candidatus Hydrogenedens sp.]
MAEEKETRGESTRREFLRQSAALGFAAFVSQGARAWGLDTAANPLDNYPDRDWEKVYRDLFQHDSTFTFLCAPNDTHNCLLTAYMKNGILTRISPTYRYGEASDLDGNKASHRWDPRCCQKGLALVRRFYGDRRVKGPCVRKGFKEWVDAGFPRDAVTGAPPEQYFRRAEDSWLQLSWDEVSEISAKALHNIAEAYSGEEGAGRLKAQGHYSDEMIETCHGAGTQVLKFRGGMPLLGTRIYAMNRFANGLALLDNHIRKTGPEGSFGGRGWDSYSWHTDLPPGHPMVTGQQTVDFDLCSVEHSKMVIVWGMNWICTKMPDSHWLTEARMKGVKVVVIACEYSATASKGDEVLVVRPGTTPALALGLAGVIMRENLQDTDYVKKYTDMPLLVRLDTRALLSAQDVLGGEPAPLTNFTKVFGKDETPPPPVRQSTQWIPKEMRDAWGDFIAWDTRENRPARVTRDDVGENFTQLGVEPALEGRFQVTLQDGSTVEAAPIYALIKEHLERNYNPQTSSGITWAPPEAIEKLAREIAKNARATMFPVGMGPNQFFNNDLKDRSVFLLAALTGNVGNIGGNVGSYAGNYRTAHFNGYPQFIYENPFDIETDPAKPARVKSYWKGESAHFFNYGDRELRVGNKNFTGKGHTPTPTKSVWLSNSNSIIGNAKWHYDLVYNTLPKVEMLAVSDWWWTASCEWADIVFGVDSWAEMKSPDMTASVTNPFLTVFPDTPLPRLFDTRGDMEVLALVSDKLAAITGDTRFSDLWRYAHGGKTQVYLQRILNMSNSAAGYQIADLLGSAKEGVPALMMTRTTPRSVGFEQVHENRPWYTKTGRLTFYIDEREFIENGENLPVHREPVDSTFHEPNVIVCAPDPLLNPLTPRDCGFAEDDLGVETRQGRHVIKRWEDVSKTSHPLMKDGFKFIMHTPKYRHGAHTTPIDTDIIAVYFGPFGDIFRHDTRKPFVTEGYVDINPGDAREIGVDDGDYVWIDADPSDRPFRGQTAGDGRLKVSRLLARARYYNGTPRGVTRMWFNMYGATPGSVRGQRERGDGLAKNPDTNYQAMFRSGSHQSGTRAWLKPTLMTDSLVRKEGMGHAINKGFLADVHCPTGAPRETFVKITKAEDGGIGGTGKWKPLTMGIRPTNESETFRKYLDGGFIEAAER